jgi:hypothetical protein
MIAIPGLLKSAFDLLKSPVGIIVVALAIYGFGYWRGGGAAAARFELEKRQSIEAARAIDESAAQLARQTAEQQRIENDQLKTTLEKRIADYEKSLVNYPNAGCSLLPSDIDRLSNPSIRSDGAHPAPVQ